MRGHLDYGSATGNPSDLRELLGHATLACELHAVLCARWGLPYFGDLVRNDLQHVDLIRGFARSSHSAALPDDPMRVLGLRPIVDELADWGGESKESALLASCYVQELALDHLRRLIVVTVFPRLLLLCEELASRRETALKVTAHRYQEQQGECYQPQVLESLDWAGPLRAGGHPI